MSNPMKWFMFSLLAALTIGRSVQAQTAAAAATAAPPAIFKNPALEKSRTATALGGLAARLAHPETAKAAAVAESATRFTPSGKRILLEPFLESVARTADEKQGLRQVLEAVFTAYEKAAADAGHPNDLAAALTFYLAAHYTAFHGGSGGEVSDPAQNAIFGQLQSSLATAALQSASSSDKQTLYEFFVLMGGFTGAMRELGAEQKDAALQKLSHQLGADGLTFVLKVKPETVQISDTGLHFTPDSAAKTAAKTSLPLPPRAAATTGTGGGSLHDISYTLPAGWSETRSEGSVILKAPLDGFTEPRDCTLIITPGLARTGTLADSLKKRWQELALPLFDGEAAPFPIAVSLPGGLSAAYCAEEMHGKQNKGLYGVSCYAIDAGGGAVVVVTAIFPDQLFGMYGNKKYTDSLEQFLGSLKIQGAPVGKPLVTTGELAGYWSNSSTSYASFVDSHTGDYRGDASITTGRTYTLHADGTYSHIFVGMTSKMRFRSEEAGTYRIEPPGMIAFTDKATGHVTKWWFRGLSHDDHGTMLVLTDGFSKPSLFRGLSQYDTRLVLTPPTPQPVPPRK